MSSTYRRMDRHLGILIYIAYYDNCYLFLRRSNPIRLRPGRAARSKFRCSRDGQQQNEVIPDGRDGRVTRALTTSWKQSEHSLAHRGTSSCTPATVNRFHRPVSICSSKHPARNSVQRCLLFSPRSSRYRSALSESIDFHLQ